MKKKFGNLNLQDELSKEEMKAVKGGTSCSNGWSHPYNLGCGYCEGTGRGTTNGCSSHPNYTQCSNGWYYSSWLGCGYCAATGRGSQTGC
jgi:hypothetical protein